MPEHDMATRSLPVPGLTGHDWHISAWTDADGHLSVLIQNADGTTVHDTGEPDDFLRFTSEGIESDHNSKT